MSSTRAQAGTVYLVGAGPGDPELLTVRAMRLIQSADAIFHDDLVPSEVLALARPGTLVTSVGKRCGRPRVTQAGIHKLLIDSAKANQSVVRLKSGDPLIFGRAGEELAALRASGVPFVVVPGVTAALAAGASLELPLTDRESASKLIFVTGHHAAEKSDSAPLWTGALPADATLVVYMPGRTLDSLQRDLLEAAVPGDMPVVAVSQAATPWQSYVACRMDAMNTLVPGPAPVLVLVGWAADRLLSTADALANTLRMQQADSTGVIERL